MKKYFLFLMALAAGTMPLLAQPTVIQPPTNKVVAVGGTLALSVTVTGTTPVYQWFKDGHLLLAATNSTLTVTNAGITNSGAYYVVVTNVDGMVISQLALAMVGNPSLLVWGNNNNGELGNGTTSGTNLPITVASNVMAGAAGGQHSLFVTSDGTLKAMGWNLFGQLGDGTTSQKNLPVSVANNVVAVAAGDYHSLFVKTNGTLWAMGNNSDGEFGNGTTSFSQTTPISVASNVVAVAAGGNHSLFVKTDGTLWAMGYNYYGQLGTGSGPFSYSTPGFVASNVVAVAAGFSHSLFLKKDGTLWGMGDNRYGQLGNGGGSIPVSMASNVVALAAGAGHTLFVNTDGTLWAMGRNSNGQLGNGDPTGMNVATPTSVASNVVAVVAGARHSLFVKTDGTLWAMGDNSNGELGNGTYNNTNLPVNVAGLTAANIFSMPTAYHSLAIGTQQTVVTITLGNLNQVYTGGAISVTASTAPPGLTVNLTYRNASYSVSANAPTNVGSYTVIATVTNPISLSVTNTLVISQAPAIVTLTNLNQPYDGTAKPVGVTTSPSGLTVNVTYNGSPSAPTNAGGYIVIATISDPNYYGSVTNILNVEPSTTPDGIIWTQTGASSANWHSVASSADGSKLIAAVEFGGVYLSTNSGVAWTQAVNGLPGGSAAWISVASSADGTHLGAVDFNSGVYISHNSGANWALQSLPAATWFAVAVSADGREWLAAANLDSSHTGPGPLYTSPNYGTSWVSNNLPLQNWVSIAASADGKTLAAAAHGIQGANLNYSGPIYTSTNYGAPWRLSNLPNQIWSSIACSADGSKLMAVALNGPVCVSTNSGTVWTPASSPIATNWLSVAASADGTKFTAEVAGGNIYTTTNLGVSWMLDNAPNTNWAGITLSADGNKMAAVVFGGGIYTAQLTPAPQLSLMPTNGSLGFSWIIPSMNFVLQQGSDLTTTNWSLVTNTPVLNLTNLQNQVALPLPAGNAFYRLKTP